MKKIILLIACVLAGTYYLQAQNVPQGMNYQAVARNSKGQMLQNKDIALRISLRSDGPAGKIVYTEIHKVTTNNLGLFNLIIGQGLASEKVGVSFADVPWADAEVWMEIGLDEQGGENFEVLNVSKLMSVPYAFHAGTADKIKDRSFEEWYGELDEEAKRRGGSTGIPFWTVWGNSNVDTNYHWMGTSVAQDVIFKGNNIEAIRIKTDGSVNISGNSSFGDDLFVRRNLTVGQNTTLRGMLGVVGATTLQGTLDVDLATTLKDDLNVKKNTALEGTLDVDLATTLKDDLNVKKNTALEGTLDVDLATTLKDDLNVKKNTALEGTLDVDLATTLKDDLNVKKNTALEGTLDVDLATTLKDDLNVKKNTALEGTLDVDLATTLKDDLNVKKNTALEGTLDVDLATTLKDDLNVKKNTALEGTLDVDLATTLKDDLNVKKNTTLEGTLDVDNATTLKDSLVVEGETILKDKLSISDDIKGFVFTVENTNGDEAAGGDGIQIKLGRTHPAWSGSAYLNVTNPGAELFDGGIQTVRGWITGQEFEFTDLLDLVPQAYIAGTACNLVESLVDEINSGIGLPFDLSSPINTGLGLPFDLSDPINNGLGLPFDLTAPINNGLGLPAGIEFNSILNAICDICVDDDDLPGPTLTLIPALPSLNIPEIPALEVPALPSIEIPAIPSDLGCDNLPSFSPPVLSFINVDNSLTTENQFASFVDKDDRELGSIKAISVTEWGEFYFDGVYLVNFIGSAVGLDPLGAATGAISELTNIVDTYNKLGVEYTSGHGDYAEWLERVDPKEIISRGDIVAVVGGKISKNIEQAEQIMAVSEHPIVLGNLPPAEKAHLGNNVAFMGQIPVKVMGPVQSGDYIVADNQVPGYGIAIHPHDIKVEHTKFIVGRSWETRTDKGPKMVNTVVGVHNGDYFRILQKYEQKFRDSEARFEALESKIDRLHDRLDANLNDN